MTVRALCSATDLEARAHLLASRGLAVPTADRSWGAFEEGQLVATLGALGETLVGFAVAPSAEGRGLATALAQRAVMDLFAAGVTNIRAFTKPSEEARFAAIGFHTAARAPEAILIEWKAGFAQHLKKLEALAADKPKGAAALVLNANPFTLGHRHLVEAALRDHPFVWVFIVSEDVSAFRFDDRLAMARAALADLTQVTVLPSGPYMVSLATFPSYFTKEASRVRVHAELDLALFIEQAKALNVSCRLAGEEPFSPATAEYNRVMQRVLPAAGIHCQIIPRLSLPNGAVISASAVRRLLAKGKIAEARAFLPDTSGPLLAGALERTRLLKENS